MLSTVFRLLHLFSRSDDFAAALQLRQAQKRQNQASWRDGFSARRVFNILGVLGRPPFVDEQECPEKAFPPLDRPHPGQVIPTSRAVVLSAPLSKLG